MNNNTANVTSISAVTADLIQEIYLGYVYTLIDVSMLSLLFYTTVLAMPQEMEYMWLSRKCFSIPNLLYALTRYGCLICQVLAFSLNLEVASSASLPVCNDLANIQNAATVLTFVGVQGLLVVRTYSLCQGNKIITGALAVLFFVPLIINIFNVADPGCILSYRNLVPETLTANICTCITDFLALCVCLWKVWGIWKLKRDIGIQNYNDLVSVLFRQSVLRFCFVIAFTIILTIVDIIIPSAVNIMGDFQHSFSAIILADFTLELRQKNSAAIQAKNVTLPTIEFQSVMRYIHESIILEMGDHENVHTREGDDDPLGSPDVEIRCEESA